MKNCMAHGVYHAQQKYHSLIMAGTSKPLKALQASQASQDSNTKGKNRISDVNPSAGDVSGDPPLGHGLTPMAIACLPEIIRLSLIEEAAAAQSATLLKKLLEAKAFQGTLVATDLPFAVEFRQSSTTTLGAYAALARVLRSCRSEMITHDSRSGKAFASAVGYEVKILPIDEDFRDVFGEVIIDFIRQAKKIFPLLVNSDLAGHLQSRVKAFEDKCVFTCGPLLCAAIGLNDLKSMGHLLEFLKSIGQFPSVEDKESPVFRRPRLRDKLMISEKVFLSFSSKLPPTGEVGEGAQENFIHPARVAILMGRYQAQQILVDNGFQADTDTILSSTTRTEDGGTRFFKSAQKGILIDLMGSGDAHLTPAMADVALGSMGLGPRNLLGKNLVGNTLLAWTMGLVSGDEPELDVIEVARKHGLFAIDPPKLFYQAASSGCPEFLEAACEKMDWTLPQKLDKSELRNPRLLHPALILANLLQGRFWEGSEKQMLHFTEMLIDSVQKAGRPDLLSGTAKYQNSELTLLQFLAARGSDQEDARALYKALEMGLDPQQTMPGAPTPLKIALSQGKTFNAAMIQSHLAKKAALRAMDSLGSDVHSYSKVGTHPS